MTAEGFNRLWLVAAGLIGTVVYFVALLIRRRSFYRDLPCPPHSLFWGHLKLVGEYLQAVGPGTYTQLALTQMKLDHDLPDVFYLDLWPVGPRMLVCTAPEACAIPTTINAFEIPELVTKFFETGIGDGFIEATNGPVWKHLHQMLAPGLTPGAVKGYNNSIVEEAVALHERIRDIAKSAQVVDMRKEWGVFPFQVIAHVLFGERLSMELYETTSATVDVQTAINAAISPLAKRRLGKDMSHYWKRIEAEIEAKTRARFAELQQQKVFPNKTNATNLLDRMLLSQIQAERPLESELLKLVQDNVKGFLVAGFGTTTDTSSYIFMLLSAFPEALKKLREEHDRVFPKDFENTVRTLQEQPGLIKNLEYTTAVINETLRLFPIGFGIRSPPPGMTDLEYQGRKYPVKGHVLAVSSHTMHYDPKYFDEPKKFKPERFLAAEPTFPRNAYRPFERGLRSCLGLSLAMDEMKIMLVLVSRWFDFELEDHQAAEKPLYSFTDLDTKIGKHAFQAWSFTATPVGEVKMKVNLAN